MTHLINLSVFRQNMIKDIKLFMSEYNLKLIRFDTMFSCILPEENRIEDGSFINVCIAKRMWDNGVIEGINESEASWDEWSVDDLDACEVAYILDALEAGQYQKLNPDSYDEEKDSDDQYDEENEF